MHVTKTSKAAVIRSANIQTKQAIWGWADGGDRACFYGRATGRGEGDKSEWEWTLNKHDVRNLISDLHIGLMSPETFGLSGADKRLYKKIIKALEA